MSRSLQQGQRLNQGHTMTFHTYTPLEMSIPSINFLHLIVPKIYPGQGFKGQGHYGSFKGQGHYGNFKGQIKITP